ncbi:RDD family protein [Streptomyces polygonati]|uniref:RDD family protein n=1 Tax=Streptomyces polygonati TaxID=1617087 RepID=A0ABV8HLI8_9ACTN
MSQPPDPSSPYGEPQPKDQPQPQAQPPSQEPYGGGQPYGAPQQPYPYPYPPQPGAYGQPPQQPYGYPPAGYQQPPPPYGYGYAPGPGVPLPGMPPLASWGARLGAFLLDWLMFFLIPQGLAGAGYIRIILASNDRLNTCDDQGIPSDRCSLPHPPTGSIILILLGGVLALGAVFFIAYREGSTGQSPGKRIVGIRLLKEYDGATLGFGLAFGRRLLHILDNLACYIGWLWPLWDPKRQTFADKVLHTVVIKDQT